MAAYHLQPTDEYSHPPGPEPHFNESVYCNAFDDAVRVGGWMRIGNRVNEGYAELSVCLYLPDGRIACQFQRPSIAANDRFAAGGLAFDVAEPLQRATMTFAGELLVLDDPDALRDPASMFERGERVPGSVVWEQTTVSPAHGGVPTSPDQDTMYGRDFSLGHFNQHTRVTGSIRVGDQSWEIRGSGWRDHSWGPRLWQNIHFYRLFVGNVGERGFMLLKLTEPDGRARRVGVLLVDGRYEDILDMDVVTEWTDRQDQARVQLGVRTAKRSAIIEGEVITLAPLRNRRKIGDEMVVSRVAEGFTRFTWDGAVGYGMSEYIERLEGDRPIGYPL